MSRTYSLPTVLRMVPNRCLKEFFDLEGHPSLPVAWNDLKERDIDPMLHALAELPRAENDRLEAALRNLHDLSCEAGISALLEAARMCGDDGLAAQMPDASFYGQAAWFWLHHHEHVEPALHIHQVETLSWWRLRSDLPRVPIAPSPDAVRDLERAISELLVREQGRGRRCTVEEFRRHGTVYFFAHPDDFVRNVTSHDDDGRLAARAYRGTFDIVFAFHAGEGTLELFAKVPPRLKPQLETIFARTMLGCELEDVLPEAYRLDRLKHRSFELATDPQDAVEVRVRRLRLSFKNRPRRLLLDADPDGPTSDLHDMMDEVLDQERVPPSSVHVTLATFCFEFRAVDGRKPGSLTFDVAYPHSCSLRNQRPERVELAMKYLKRWGIHVARNPVDALAGAGARAAAAGRRGRGVPARTRCRCWRAWALCAPRPPRPARRASTAAAATWAGCCS